MKIECKKTINLTKEENEILCKASTILTEMAENLHWDWAQLGEHVFHFEHKKTLNGLCVSEYDEYRVYKGRIPIITTKI